MRPIVLLMTEGARAFARRKLGDAQGAADAAEAMIANALTVAQSAGEVVVCAPATSQIAITRSREGKALLKQTSGPLGARVSAALAGARQIALPGQPVLLIGDDCPGMTEEHLAEAVEALEHGAQTVLGRARDGGFWLVGLASWDAPFAHSLAANVDWSTPRAFSSLRTFLVSTFPGAMAFLPELADLDAPGDLAEAIRAAETLELKTILAHVRPGRALAGFDDEITLTPRGELGLEVLWRASSRA